MRLISFITKTWRFVSITNGTFLCSLPLMVLWSHSLCNHTVGLAHVNTLSSRIVIFHVLSFKVPLINFKIFHNSLLLPSTHMFTCSGSINFSSKSYFWLWAYSDCFFHLRANMACTTLHIMFKVTLWSLEL